MPEKVIFNTKQAVAAIAGLLIFLKCSTNSVKKTPVKETAVINYITKHFRSDKSETFLPGFVMPEKIWYQDSFAIETVSGLFINSDSKGTTQEVKVRFYRFSDLRSWSAYEYDSFSDTSKLIRKYKYSDTSIHLNGGWGFNFKRKWVYNDKPEPMSDTIINKVYYKRLRLNRDTGERANIAICYFRCDRNDRVFIYDSLLTERMGCPLTRVDNYPVSGRGVAFSLETDYLTDTFSAPEQRVFNAWLKYAKENPVESHR